MFKNKFKKILLTLPIMVGANTVNAAYDINVSENDKLTFGGFIKVNARHVSGDVAYQHLWLGAGLAKGNGVDGAFDGTNKSQVNLNADETRFNIKYIHGEVIGFIELDFVNSAQGNQIISNSVSPRIRHGYIKYKDITVGQTWTTFMNTSAIPETIDFAGPAMGLAFIRQGQIRYTYGNFQLSLENPFTFGGDSTLDDIPDLVIKYNMKGDWGNVSFAGLARRLNTVTGNSESAFGYSAAGRIKTIGKDDFRFQVHGGNVGRYVGVVSAPDIVGEKVEETTSYLASYRHFWSDDLRSTLAYAHSEAELSGWKSTQWSINLFKNLTKQLSIGVEVGNFKRDDQNADSNFTQFTMLYVI